MMEIIRITDSSFQGSLFCYYIIIRGCPLGTTKQPICTEREREKEKKH